MCKINMTFLLVVPHCLLPDTAPEEGLLPESEFFTQHSPVPHESSGQKVQKSPPAVAAQRSAQACEGAAACPLVMSLKV